MKKRNIWLGLLILFTIFIFSRSLKSAEESSIESSWIVMLSVKFVKLIFSQVPDNINQIMTFIVRKTAHAAEYFVDGCLLCGFFSTFKNKVKGNVPWILLIGLFTACTDELLQSFPPGRSPEVRDVFVDFAGIVCALILCVIVSRLKNKKNVSHKI